MHLKFSNLKNSICVLLISFYFQSFAVNHLPENLSENAQLSLLTCDEGGEIYSLFGHSALRIFDVENQIDIVFNWGMFEWPEDQFDFGYQFAKGKLKFFYDIANMSNDNNKDDKVSYMWLSYNYTLYKGEKGEFTLSPTYRLQTGKNAGTSDFDEDFTRSKFEVTMQMKFK